MKGDNSNSGTSPGDAWQTITKALTDTVRMKDNLVTIHVAAGTYNTELGERFPLEMKSYVSIKGHSRMTTTIDAIRSNSSVITCSGSLNVLISGLTITGGSGTWFEDS